MKTRVELQFDRNFFSFLKFAYLFYVFKFIINSQNPVEILILFINGNKLSINISDVQWAKNYTFF